MNKAVYTMKSSSRQIGFSVSKAACDSKTSPIDSFQSSMSNVKDSFFTMQKSIARTVITQRQGTLRPFKHVALVNILNNSVQSHTASPSGLAVVVNASRQISKM